MKTCMQSKRHGRVGIIYIENMCVSPYYNLKCRRQHKNYIESS